MPAGGSRQEVSVDDAPGNCQDDLVTEGTPRTQGSQGDLHSLARGSMLTLVGLVSAAVLQFVLTLIVTRGVDTATAGVVLESIALFTILSNWAELGADTGAVRVIPQLRATGRTNDIRVTLAAALVPVLAVGAILAVAGVVLAHTAAGTFFSPDRRSGGMASLRAVAPFLPLSCALTVALAATRGFGTMVPYVSILNVGVPLLRVVLVFAAVAAGSSAAVIMLGWSLPLAVGFAFALISLGRRAHRLDRGRARPSAPAGGVMREFWSFAAPRGLAAMFGVTVTYLDVLLVGAMASTHDAAVYAAASRLAVIGTYALQAVGMVVAPQFAGMMARGEHERVERLYQVATWWMMALSWPLYIALAVFASSAMRLFGPAYTDGAAALTILSIAGLVNLGTGNVTILLLMAGRSSWNMANAAVSLGLNIALNLVLIPAMGIEGAAIAWAVSIITNNVMALLELRILLRLRPFGSGYGLIAGAATACFAGLGALARWKFGDTATALAVSLPPATVVYAALLVRWRTTLELGALRASLPHVPLAFRSPILYLFASRAGERHQGGGRKVEHELSTLGDYLRVLRRRKWLVVFCIAVAVGLGYLYTAHQTKLYEANAQVAVAGVQTTNPYGGTFGPSNSTNAARALATEAVVAHTPEVASAAARAAGVRSVTPASLLAASTVTANPNANVLTFTVRNHRRADAVALANAYANQYVRLSRARMRATAIADRARLLAQVRRLERTVQGGGPKVAAAHRPQIERDTQSLTDLAGFLSALPGATRVVSPAARAGLAQPKLSRDLVVALAVGLVVALLAAFIRDAVDTRVRSATQLTAALGLPVLGRIAAFRGMRRQRLVRLDPGRPGADAFRSLAIRISLVSGAGDRDAIMVTSALGREGKSMTAANLAVAFAEAGKQVVLVDLDLAHPSIGPRFGLRDQQVGLVDVVHGGRDLVEALHPIALFAKRSARPPGTSGGLQVLPAGASGETDPVATLASPVLADLIGALRGRADVVLLDTPPLLAGSSAMAISRLADHLLLVARVEALRRRHLGELQDILAALPVAKLGLVMTGKGAEHRSADPELPYVVLPDTPAGRPNPVKSATEIGRAV